MAEVNFGEMERGQWFHRVTQPNRWPAVAEPDAIPKCYSQFDDLLVRLICILKLRFFVENVVGLCFNVFIFEFYCCCCCCCGGGGGGGKGRGPMRVS